MKEYKMPPLKPGDTVYLNYVLHHYVGSIKDTAHNENILIFWHWDRYANYRRYDALEDHIAAIRLTKIK